MPLNAKGAKIMSSMTRTYGKKKAKQVFYASKNSGRIKGVDHRRLNYKRTSTPSIAIS